MNLYNNKEAVQTTGTPTEKGLTIQIDRYRNKHSSYLNTWLGVVLTYIFGLTIIDKKHILPFFPFTALILLLFLFFYDRFYHYFILEKIALFQAGLLIEDPLLKQREKITPKRMYWGSDKLWCLEYKSKVKKRLHSFIYYFTPHSKIELFLQSFLYLSCYILLSIDIKNPIYPISLPAHLLFYAVILSFFIFSFFRIFGIKINSLVLNAEDQNLIIDIFYFFKKDNELSIKGLSEFFKKEDKLSIKDLSELFEKEDKLSIKDLSELFEKEDILLIKGLSELFKKEDILLIKDLSELFKKEDILLIKDLSVFFKKEVKLSIKDLSEFFKKENILLIKDHSLKNIENFIEFQKILGIMMKRGVEQSKFNHTDLSYALINENMIKLDGKRILLKEKLKDDDINNFAKNYIILTSSRKPQSSRITSLKRKIGNIIT